MRTQRFQESEKLQALTQQFSQWRQSRSSSSERIPKHLLDQALALAGPQPWSAVLLRKLGLNHTQLKRHQQSKATHNNVPVEFVPLPTLPALSKAVTTHSPTVQFTRQDGQQMTLSDLNMEQLSHLVSGFMQLSKQEG